MKTIDFATLAPGAQEMYLSLLAHQGQHTADRYLKILGDPAPIEQDPTSRAKHGEITERILGVLPGNRQGALSTAEVASEIRDRYGEELTVRQISSSIVHLCTKGQVCRAPLDTGNNRTAYLYWRGVAGSRVARCEEIFPLLPDNPQAALLPTQIAEKIPGAKAATVSMSLRWLIQSGKAARRLDRQAGKKKYWRYWRLEVADGT